MDATLNVLLSNWKAHDLKMNRECSGGYTPSSPVIANRLAGYYEQVLSTLASAVRQDAWMEQAYEYVGRTFQVGFRDNVSLETYNAACTLLAERVRALGWKVRICSRRAEHALFITLPASIERESARVHPLYIAHLHA